MGDDLKELLDLADEMDHLHDVTFRIGPSVIPAHRFILYSNARRFYEEFCSASHIEEIHHDPVDIKEISEEVFQFILEFIYMGSCEFFDPQSLYWKQFSALNVDQSKSFFIREREEVKNEPSASELLKNLQKAAKKLKIDSLERILEKVSPIPQS